MKLIVFDFDNTLMDGETIEFLAKENNCLDEVSKITKDAMSGKIDFFNSLNKRVELLKGLKIDKVNEICSNLPMIKGFESTLKKLKSKGYLIACFSGGFRNATINLLEYGLIDIDFANILHTKDGILTGKVGGEMMFDDSKGSVLKRLQRLLSISEKDTVVVGDGANDLSMFKYAKIKIAFCANDILKKEANIIIEEKDLCNIIKNII